MKLRKVLFMLGKPDGYLPDQTDEELQEQVEITKERQGAFHCWAPGVIYSPELDKDIPGVLGLIEEIETGKIFEIAPELITFCVPCEFWDPKE